VERELAGETEALKAPYSLPLYSSQTPTLSDLGMNQSHCTAKLVTDHLSCDVLRTYATNHTSGRFTNYNLRGLKIAEDEKACAP
jgi:hypothetical protein